MKYLSKLRTKLFPPKPVEYVDLKKVTYAVITEEETHTVSQTGKYLGDGWFYKIDMTESIDWRTYKGVFRVSNSLSIPLCKIKKFELISLEEYLVKKW